MQRFFFSWRGRGAGSPNHPLKFFTHKWKKIPAFGGDFFERLIFQNYKKKTCTEVEYFRQDFPKYGEIG